MTELEKLKAQKKEIDRRIRELQDTAIIVNGAKLDAHRYQGLPDEWFVAIKMLTRSGKPRWQPISVDENKQKCIDRIDTIVADLMELKKKLEGEE